MSDPSNITEAPRREQLLKLLADGQVHSGERLAEQLDITRAAVWKAIQSLRDLGIELESQHQGYCLPMPVDLYDAARIRSELQAQSDYLERINVLFTVDSTNRFVTAQPATLPDRAVLCVAEIQQAGRGRRGRSWVAPFGSGICMSLGWLFDAVPPAFSALTLVVGVALVRALHQFGATEVGLKWPNDLLWRNRKLAGVLIEMRGEPDGPAHVVIGIGMNLHLPDASRQLLAEQQAVVTDLFEVLGDACPPRNVLVAVFTAQLLQVLRQFSRDGFAPFVNEWQSHDVLRAAEVNVLQGERSIAGVARGITDDGSLLVETAEGLQRFVSGEVSLRPRSI
ncbi:MAG: bifunctional biotin--[acetyl-CoA-carboxylase] ligase/biotin operon repressor BirA [Steroidobacteraceae bacterium]